MVCWYSAIEFLLRNHSQLKALNGLNSLKQSTLDIHFHSSFIVMIFSSQFVFDSQLISLRESAKQQRPFNKVPLVLLNISLPALLFHTPPLFHVLIKETECRRMKERVIKMRSDGRFQPFVMNISWRYWNANFMLAVGKLGKYRRLKQTPTLASFMCFTVLMFSIVFSLWVESCFPPSFSICLPNAHIQGCVGFGNVGMLVWKWSLPSYKLVKEIVHPKMLNMCW